MEKKQKILLTLILVISVFIITIVVLLITLLQQVNSNNEIQNNDNFNNMEFNTNIIENEVENIYYDEAWDIEEDEQDQKLEYVNNRSTYFGVKTILENYVNLIGNRNQTELKKMLSPQYVADYHITDENIFNIQNMPQLSSSNGEYYKVSITKMLTMQMDNSTYIYIVSGIARIADSNTKTNVQVMIEEDTNNGLYNLYPHSYIENNGINKLNVGDTIANYKKNNIQNRGNNQFNYVTKTDQEMANEYFNNYKELLLYSQDEAYNQLDAEYSKKRFENKKDFNTYLNDNSMVIRSMVMNQYEINFSNGYTDYICTDQYNNTYIFRQQSGIMNYVAFLDNYTIMQENEKNEYNKLEENEKAVYCARDFIKKVNTKDYKGIYNNLDNTFKNNNFKTLESLKLYIQNNMYRLNSIKSSNEDHDTYDYHIFQCILTNMENTDETKGITIIINLDESTMNYTVSFSFITKQEN